MRGPGRGLNWKLIGLVSRPRLRNRSKAYQEWSTLRPEVDVQLNSGRGVNHVIEYPPALFSVFFARGRLLRMATRSRFLRYRNSDRNVMPYTGVLAARIDRAVVNRYWISAAATMSAQHNHSIALKVSQIKAAAIMPQSGQR